MSFSATTKGSTEIEVYWDLSLDIDGQTILSLTITQTEWVGGLPKPNTATTQNVTGQTGKLKFKNLLPSTTYSYQIDAVWQDWGPDEPPIYQIPASTTAQAAATTTSGLTNVGNGSFVFDVVYTHLGASAPETQNATRNALFSQFIPSTLTPILNTPIGQQLNTIWNTDPTSSTDPTPLRQHYSTYVANTVAKQASAAGYAVNSVQCTLPGSGEAYASAHGATPGAEGQPATPGTLIISYVLTGCTVSFDYGSVITSEYQVSFDATLNITISLPATPPVPATPPTPPPAQTSLVPSAEIVVTNAQMATENFAAELAAFFDGLLSALSLGYVVTFESKITGKTDGYSQSTDIPAIDSLVSQINTIGTQVIPIGFTAFTVEIVGDNIVFKIIYPTDPAPVLQNRADGELDGPPQPPVLNLGKTQVPPGATGLSVAGGNFPCETVDQLSIWWINTASQPIGIGNVVYYPDGTSEVMQAAAFIGTTLVFEYTATDLQPDTLYAFIATSNGFFTSSAYSQPLVLRTASTATVNLVLIPAGVYGTNGPTLGSAPLPYDPGPWNPSPVTIPVDTTPGDYVIAAVWEGEILASAPINVLAPGETAMPVLNVVEGGTNPPVVIPAPANTVGGLNFWVQGKNFAPGVVIVQMNGVAPGTITEADAEGGFLLSLIAPGPESAVGLVTITASGVNGAASTTVQELGIFMV